MSKRYLIGLAAFLPWLFAMSSHSNTLRVPSEYSTINMALDASMEGDTVLVAPGTYAEAEERWVLLNNLLLVTSLNLTKALGENRGRLRGSTPSAPVLALANAHRL